MASYGLGGGCCNVCGLRPITMQSLQAVVFSYEVVLLRAPFAVDGGSFCNVRCRFVSPTFRDDKLIYLFYLTSSEAALSVLIKICALESSPCVIGWGTREGESSAC